MEESQPGQIVAPGGNTNPTGVATPTNSSLPEAATYRQPVPATTAIDAAPAAPAVAVGTTGGAMTYGSGATPESSTEAVLALPPENRDNNEVSDGGYSDELVNWTAPEFIYEEKTVLWYGMYILGTIILGGVVFLATRDIISTALVTLASLGLMIFGMRRPREQQYSLGDNAVQIGQKVYRLQDFKAFSVDDQNTIPNVTLLPLKRFMPPVTMYPPQTVMPNVEAVLADNLPSEPHKLDAIDSLLKRIRF